MTIDEYQRKALKTAYVDPRNDLLMEKTIWVMGIAGEAGEVVEKWKKIVAYQGGDINPEDLGELSKELGDVVWYIAVLANSLGLSMSEILQQNLNKLADRASRKVIKGNGDNR